jgi:hypothetical protein
LDRPAAAATAKKTWAVVTTKIIRSYVTGLRTILHYNQPVIMKTMRQLRHVLNEICDMNIAASLL